MLKHNKYRRICGMDDWLLSLRDELLKAVMKVLFFAHRSRRKINYYACARTICDFGISNIVHVRWIAHRCCSSCRWTGSNLVKMERWHKTGGFLFNRGEGRGHLLENSSALILQWRRTGRTFGFQESRKCRKVINLKIALGFAYLRYMQRWWLQKGKRHD